LSLRRRAAYRLRPGREAPATLHPHAPTLALRLSRELRERIRAWAAAAYPAEGCGLLLGHHLGEATEVTEACLARNLDTQRACDRYELDPADHLAAHERARSLGLEVVGVWHSHPDHAARPSEIDRARAWNGWSYLIVSVDARGARELGSWRSIDGRFHEEALSPRFEA
jgi:proteasome lid subunit RPN8/RPN11